MIRPRSTHDQPMITLWSNYDQTMINPWSHHDQPMIKPWSTYDHTMSIPWSHHVQPNIKPWSQHDHTMIKPWSTLDQTMINPWSNHDQTMITPWWYHDHTMTTPSLKLKWNNKIGKKIKCLKLIKNIYILIFVNEHFVLRINLSWLQDPILAILSFIQLRYLNSTLEWFAKTRELYINVLHFITLYEDLFSTIAKDFLRVFVILDFTTPRILHFVSQVLANDWVYNLTDIFKILKSAIV